MNVKQKIREAFNTASVTYDSAADWQLDVGQQLFQLLQPFAPNNKTILDLGCGTGKLLNQINKMYPNNDYIALDIAENMLNFAKQHPSKASFLCADAEALSLKTESIDIILSNLMMQWSTSFKTLISEQYRVLKHEGLLIFSILGKNSLNALKKAWHSIDTEPHVNTFLEKENIIENCENAGFEIIEFNHHSINKHYKNVYELMRHLKDTGARTVIHKQSNHLIGKNKLKILDENYENPISYEIFMIICKKR